MPWHGWPPAPARPMTGDGSPMNSLTISLMPTSLASVTWRRTETEFRFSLSIGITPGSGEASDAVAESGIRPRRCQSPRPGLLGHEADGRVLHAGARHAADQDDRPACRVRPALLFRHGRWQRPG